MGRVMIVAVVVWLGACAQSSSLVCGDGRTCPGNSTCDDLHHICVSPSQRAACDGLQNGETCTFEGQVGLCDEGVCIGASCGNTVVDADEACDDGNRDDGDGCRGDCKKIEMCGDGVVDSGEACDDSNTNSADGCDACVRTEWAVSVTIGTQAADELKLYQPQQMALDRLGNLYIADSLNHRIRRIEPSGAALTIAGTGVSGFAGDGGLATSALMSRPSALVVDGLGNVYFADSGNHRVR